MIVLCNNIFHLNQFSFVVVVVVISRLTTTEEEEEEERKERRKQLVLSLNLSINSQKNKSCLKIR